MARNAIAWIIAVNQAGMGGGGAAATGIRINAVAVLVDAVSGNLGCAWVNVRVAVIAILVGKESISVGVHRFAAAGRLALVVFPRRRAPCERQTQEYTQAHCQDDAQDSGAFCSSHSCCLPSCRFRESVFNASAGLWLWFNPANRTHLIAVRLAHENRTGWADESHTVTIKIIDQRYICTFFRVNKFYAIYADFSCEPMGRTDLDKHNYFEL